MGRAFSFCFSKIAFLPAGLGGAERALGASMEEKKEARYTPFEGIPADRYELTSVVRNDDGTVIELEGETYRLTLSFGFTEALCVCDEGRRIRAYHEIPALRSYRSRETDFYGNPLFCVTEDSDFMRWLNAESCGFSRADRHFAVITRNDFIDIAAAFPPEVRVAQWGENGAEGDAK